jgi:hypothetical protein
MVAYLEKLFISSLILLNFFREMWQSGQDNTKQIGELPGTMTENLGMKNGRKNKK